MSKTAHKGDKYFSLTSINAENVSAAKFFKLKKYESYNKTDCTSS